MVLDGLTNPLVIILSSQNIDSSQKLRKLEGK
jgi:hypothetical protein